MQKQPRPKDTTDEQTIESNLKKIDYDPKEDIMRQGEEIDADLENTDKQADAVIKTAPPTE